MFVRRVISRLAHILTRDVARRPRASRPQTAVTPAGLPVAVLPGARAAGIRNWLEDGRRLRLAHRPRRGDWTVLGLRAAATDAPREPITSGSARRTIDPPSVLPTQPLEVAGSPARAPLPPAAGDLSSAEALLQAAEGMDEVGRRLVFVRYLVRQRVYNEGFTADELPDQYRWSTGAEEPGGN